MMDFLQYTIRNRWPELLGLIFTLTSGFLIPWISKKSGNYKKINKKMMLYCLLHLVYLSVVPLVISSIGVIVIVFAATIAEVYFSILVWAASYFILTVITLLLFFWVMKKSKRMVAMMSRAAEVSSWLPTMFKWVAILSIVLSYINLTFIGSPYEELVMNISLVISWGFQFWWLFLAALLVWKASNYVYSRINITMMDGEKFSFDCSPKVCRVYRNYIRIRKRDENDVVIQELQINEVAVKQIEYLK